MSENIVRCATCGRKIDLDINASSRCTACKRYFCCGLDTACFSNHRKLYDCYTGSDVGIFDPTWLVKMTVTTSEEDRLPEPPDNI